MTDVASDDRPRKVGLFYHAIAGPHPDHGATKKQRRRLAATLGMREEEL